MQPEIRLNLTLDEANTVLEALGGLPYARVHLLIGKIQRQATGQLERAERGESQEDVP